ncbi:MAG: hypothetical protein WBO46_02560 [Caldilineaceae bacterium]
MFTLEVAAATEAGRQRTVHGHDAPAPLRVVQGGCQKGVVVHDATLLWPTARISRHLRGLNPAGERATMVED